MKRKGTVSFSEVRKKIVNTPEKKAAYNKGRHDALTLIKRKSTTKKRPGKPGK